MASHPGLKTISGRTTVAAAGTAVKLCTAALSEWTCIEVQVQCDPSNAGAQCAIGDKNTLATKVLGKPQGLVLEKKMLPVRLEVGDPSQLYVDAETSGDFVTWLLVVAN